MDEQQSIEQLQLEIERLSKELSAYQGQIETLRKQIDQLTIVGKTNVSKERIVAKPVLAVKDWSLENFIGLRLIHLVGMVVLVIGLSIGVKYAIDRNLISEGARIVFAYAAGGLLYLLSLRLQKKYTVFSAILFSGGMASLYFTTYGAFVYYQLFSFALSFGLMILLTLYTVYKAIDYNRQEIALLGLVGAYATPFLVSKNADQAELFFLYISLINGGVVFLAVKKQWNTVGRLAQLITWVLFIAWAAVRFTENVRSIGAVFMVFFFSLFFAGITGAKWMHKQNFTKAQAYQLVLNNLAVYTASLLLFPSFSENALAIISLIVCFFAAAQAYSFSAFWKEEQYVQRLLYGLSFILFIVFIAFQWDGLLVTLLWLLTAVLVFTWGVLRKSPAARMTAMLLMGTTLLKLVVLDSLRFSAVQKIISYVLLGILLLVISFFYQKFRHQLFPDDE